MSALTKYYKNTFLASFGIPYYNLNQKKLSEVGHEEIITTEMV